MLKYKICPSCNTKNEPTLLECLNCEADLTRVKVTDEETEKMLEENAATQPQEQVKLVRVCECGTHNPSNARKCSSCKEDISDITPIKEDISDITPIPETNEDNSKKIFVLSSLDGQYAYKITADEITVGRENVMSDYLSAKSYVSRSHAKFVVENEELYIENLSGTNFTYVNNKKITGKVKLENGDEIGLGGTNLNGKCQSEAAYFIVRIE